MSKLCPTSYFDYITPTRSWSNASREYRYGFNSKEKDFETANDDFPIAIGIGVRIYDGRLGRWLSLDPMMNQFVGLSPFSGFGDAPILVKDDNGEILRIDNGGVRLEYRDGKLYSSDESGGFSVEYTPKEDEYAQKALDALTSLSASKTGANLIKSISELNDVITVKAMDDAHRKRGDCYDNDDKSIYTDIEDLRLPVVPSGPNKKIYKTPGFIVLAHELAHANDFNVKDLGYFNRTWYTHDEKTVSESELYACHIENKIRAELGLSLRNYYEWDELKIPEKNYEPSKLISPEGTSLYFGKTYTVSFDFDEPDVSMSDDGKSKNGSSDKETTAIHNYDYYKQENSNLNDEKIK